MWNISKEFEFDFGHRVWTQNLNDKFSIDGACKCKHFHGHRGKIIVNLAADQLQSNGMVTDFKHLNIFKQFIDDVFDHKFLFDRSDPLLFHEFGIGNVTYHLYYHTFEDAFKYMKFDILEEWDLPVKEKYEGIVVLPFVPTAENLSKYFADGLSTLLSPLGVTVSSVIFYETPKAKSEYTNA